jgi:hypothetical protein
MLPPLPCQPQNLKIGPISGIGLEPLSTTIRRGAFDPYKFGAGGRFAERSKRAMSDKNQGGSGPHPLRDNRGLVNRVRRLRGQVDAIERALAGEASAQTFCNG